MHLRILVRTWSRHFLGSRDDGRGLSWDSVIGTHHRGADSADAEQMLPQQSVLFCVKSAEEQASMLVPHGLVTKQLTEASNAVQHPD